MKQWNMEKPLIFDAKRAHNRKVITYRRDGAAQLAYRGIKKLIPRSLQFDLTQATIFGLNDRLTLASSSPRIDAKHGTLRDLFNAEWQRYSDAIKHARGNVHDYGTYAYYAHTNHLVRYAPRFWHKVVAVASNSKLIADPERKLSWWEIRTIFQKTTIAVAGGSVGNGILHAAVMDMRPDVVKIADKSLYKMENINRVRLSYADMVAPESERSSATDLLLQNKARTTARQLYAVDPYLDVCVYDEGVTEENIKPFLKGAKNEPPADIVVEEVDDPRIKILIRQKARAWRIPLIMLTDVGSAIQLDVFRYDQDTTLPLAHNISDKEMMSAMERFYDNPADRATFFDFVDALIGKGYRRGELKDTIAGKGEIPTSTIIPQLGSTVMFSAGLAAETIARIRLGYEYPRRALINKKTLSVKKYY